MRRTADIKLPEPSTMRAQSCGAANACYDPASARWILAAPLQRGVHQCLDLIFGSACDDAAEFCLAA